MMLKYIITTNLNVGHYKIGKKKKFLRFVLPYVSTNLRFFTLFPYMVNVISYWFV